MLNDTVVLKRVKNALGFINTDAQDETLLEHIRNVEADMTTAGVSDEVLNDEISVGCIVRGVIDSWSLSPGEGKYSEMYKEKLVALKNESLRREAGKNV